MVVSPMKSLTYGKSAATFDAIYAVKTPDRPRNTPGDIEEWVSDIDIVANVIQGALGLGTPT
jgi:hypothetical protein